MITRRAILGSAAASPLLWNTALSAQPDEAVMAMQIGDVTSLDPGEAFEASGIEIGANCYERLIDPDPADPGAVVARLASHWEVAGDGLTYTFFLRGSHGFASGNLVTAEDAAWSLQRAVTLGKAPAFILAQLGFTQENAGARIKAIDGQALVLQVAEAWAPPFVLSCLSANVAGIIEKAAALGHAADGDLGNGWLRGASAGSGAWAVQSWTPGESLVLAAGPGAGAKLKRLVIRHVADPAAQLRMLQAGSADIARNLGVAQLRAVRDAPGAVRDAPGFVAQSQDLAVLTYIALNQGMAELAHPAVAQAVKWAIDYGAVERRVTPGTFQTHQALLPQGFPGVLDETPFHQDLDKARALMRQAGLEAGFSVTLDHPSAAPFADLAQAVAADLAAIGITVALAPAELREVIGKTRARQHQMALLRWSSDTLDPQCNAQAFCENPDNGDDSALRTLAWRSRWVDEGLTGRAEAAWRETDDDKRAAIYRQLQRDFRQRAPFVILQQQVGTAVMRPGVSGIALAALPDGTRYADLAKA